MRLPGARRINVQSHGLNCYDGYHNIYFSAALNREPGHLGILRDLGFDLAHVHEATTHEVIYQSVMRTSLRRPDATDPVTIIVPGSPCRLPASGSHRSHECHETRQYRKAQAKALYGARNAIIASRSRSITQSLFAAKTLQNMLIDIKNVTHIAAEIQHPPQSPYLLRDILRKQVRQNRR